MIVVLDDLVEILALRRCVHERLMFFQSHMMNVVDVAVLELQRQLVVHLAVFVPGQMIGAFDWCEPISVKIAVHLYLRNNKYNISPNVSSIMTVVVNRPKILLPGAMFPPGLDFHRESLIHERCERLIRQHQVKISRRPARSIHALVVNLESIRQPLLADLSRHVCAMRHLISVLTPLLDAEVSIMVDVQPEVEIQFPRFAQEFHPL